MDAQLRQSVRARAAYQCEYCRLPQEFSDLRFHIEHVIPRQHGGGDDADNLALACPDCNLRKGPNLTGIDPASGDVVRLFHPRRDVWSEHFSYKGADILGLTAVGRTTVPLLEMNAPERRRVRELVANIQG
jgi:HNH endonuclease